MTAHSRRPSRHRPANPASPEAKPETLGPVAPRLQRMSDAFKREIDKGTMPGVTVLVARARPDRLVRGARQAEPGGDRADGA